MRRGPDAASAEIDFAGIFLGHFDDVGDRMCRRRWVDHKHQRGRSGKRYSDKVLRGIDGHLAIERGGHGASRLAAHHQGVTVRIGFRQILGCDQPAGAGAVLDHNRLAENFGHLLRDDARRHVGAAAGREADEHPDRVVGITGVLRVSGASRKAQRQRECQAKNDTQRSRCLHKQILPSGPIGRVHFLDCSRSAARRQPRSRRSTSAVAAPS